MTEMLENQRVGSIRKIFVAIGFTVTLLVSCSAHAQYSPYPDWIAEAMNSTYAVAVGDVDRDGDLDLVCGNYSQENKLYLCENGELASSAVWLSALAYKTTSVALGDINKDGYLDLVCGNENQPDVLYLNDGGTFSDTPILISSASHWTYCIALGDVNNDGYLDLVCGNSGINTLYLNNYGVLADTVSWKSANQSLTRSITLGDVDKDGYLDLVCGNSGFSEPVGGSNRLYLNEGGMFPASQAWTSGGRYHTSSVVLGDVDGDGDLDLVCGNSSLFGVGENAGPNTIYLNEGGLFSIMPDWIAGSLENTESIALGDIDRDGDLDLVCGNSGDIFESNSCFINENGVFDTIATWTSVAKNKTKSVALADFDNDGDLDLICGNIGTSYFPSCALYIKIDHSFLLPHDIYREHVFRVELGDVDGDNDLDLVCANRDFGSTLHLYNGSGFDSMHSWSVSGQYFTSSIALDDIDIDGDLDLVCGNVLENNHLYKYENSTFSTIPAWSSPEADTTIAVALGKVNEDLYPDLICVDRDATKLYLNNGVNFSTVPDWSAHLEGCGEYIALGDVDDDGDLDLVCGAEDVFLYLNDGGVFDTLAAWQSSKGGSGWIDGIALGDVDGDGDLDLVCADVRCLIYLNRGGTFSSTYDWYSPYPAEGIALGDVNGDGFLDIVCINGEMNYAIAVYLNRDGNFGDSYSLWHLYWYGTHPVIGDVDNDGDLDLVTVQGSYDMVKLFKGQKNPGFQHDPLSPTHHLPNNEADIMNMNVQHAGYNQLHLTIDLIDVESDPVWIIPEYSYEGESSWQAAIFAGYSGMIGPLVSSPQSVEYQFDWDTTPLAINSRDVILRMLIISNPQRVSFFQRSGSFYKNLGALNVYRPVLATAPIIIHPAVTVGDTISTSLSLSNEGNEQLTITDIASSPFAIEIDRLLPLTLEPGDAVEVGIKIGILMGGDITGNLSVGSNDPLTPIHSIPFLADVREIDFTLARLYEGGALSASEPLKISVTMADSVYVDSVMVYYRDSGGMLFKSNRLGRIDDPIREQYFLSIEPDSISSRGVEYYVAAYNGEVVVPGDLNRLRKQVDNLDFPGSLSARKHTIISIPLEIPNNTVGGMFEDDIGSRDVSTWRVFAYIDSISGYSEIPSSIDSIEGFTQGESYWFICKDPATLDTSPLLGISTPADSAYQLILDPGWNMISNPFNFPVAWDSIIIETMEGDQWSVADAETILIEPPIGWDESIEDYMHDIRVETLVPFNGYWIKNLAKSDLKLLIPPLESIDSGSNSKNCLLASRSRSKLEDNEWLVEIRVSSGGSFDNANFFGCRRGARNSWDMLDRLEPPMSPGKSIALSFIHTDWTNRPGHYAVDIRGSSEITKLSFPEIVASEDGLWGYVWIFDVAKNFSVDGTADEILLEFAGIEGIPEDARVLLVDQELKSVNDLRRINKYHFFLGKNSIASSEDGAQFLLIIGSEEYIKLHEDQLPSLPLVTSLYQNYPNPFNPSTIIRYDLERASFISLRIFDIRGALIKVIWQGHRDPGSYETIWDGMNEAGNSVAAGIYFYQLKTEQFMTTRKMVLVK